MKYLTASMLFAGQSQCAGEYRCYYCGAYCDETYKTNEYVKSTFTNRDIVRFPGSEYVCFGCVESLGQGPDSIEMIDGTIKERTTPRGMQPRMYSWVLTQTKKVAATKAHRKYLREIILNPPEPPFVIVIADSGQKQLIFRAPVAMSRDGYPLLLEDQRIEVVPAVLLERLKMTPPICAALGKPALLGEITTGSYVRYEEYHSSIDGLERWLRIREEPMSRLAAWLSPSKEEAQYEYPGIKRTGIQAKTGGYNRSRSSNAGGNERRSEDDGRQLHLGFGESVQR